MCSQAAAARPSLRLFFFFFEKSGFSGADRSQLDRAIAFTAGSTDLGEQRSGTYKLLYFSIAAAVKAFAARAKLVSDMPCTANLLQPRPHQGLERKSFEKDCNGKPGRRTAEMPIFINMCVSYSLLSSF